MKTLIYLFAFMMSMSLTANAQTLPQLPGQKSPVASTVVASVSKISDLPSVKYVIKDQDFKKYNQKKPSNEQFTEVMVFFWYGSEWVQKMQPVLTEWEKSGKMPSRVKLTWVPIVLNENQTEWAFSARLFFALEKLGKEKDLSPIIFKALRENVLDLSSPKAVSEFLKARGVDPKDLEKAINDPLVVSKTYHLPSIAKMYGVQSTPSYVIDGEYLIASTNQLAPEKATAVMIFMAEKLSQGGSRP